MKETEVARRRRGEIKRRETDPASNQFPKCSPQPGTPREGEKRESKKRREQSSQ